MLPSLHHLALRSADVVGLAAFYQEMFELTVARDTAPRSIWLQLGGGAVLMIEAREAGEPAPDSNSMEMMAVATTKEGRATFRARAMVRGCLDGETASTVYARDPEGRRVAVSCYDVRS